MLVTYKGKPGKLMSFSGYIRFSSDSDKVKSITIEPNYSLEFLQNGLRVSGYVRKNGRFDTFKIETYDFILRNLVIIEKKV